MTRRSLFDTLRDVRGGEAIEELDANLQRLVRAVLTTGGGFERERPLAEATLRRVARGVMRYVERRPSRSSCASVTPATATAARCAPSQSR